MSLKTILIFFGLLHLWSAGLWCETYAKYSGESRLRYESLNGQYRKGNAGSDQIMALRTLLKLEGGYRRFGGVLELHDARVYLDDDGTPLSTSFVNTHDILQSYLSFKIGIEKQAIQHEFKLGRFTLDIGSRRFVERNDFRNTINSYSGVHYTFPWSGTGASIDVFYTFPVRKRPEKSQREALAKNDFEFDDQDETRRFWGIHQQNMPMGHGVLVDAFIYGLDETDRPNLSTQDRQVYSPGLRVKRVKSRGRWDFDFEGAYRFGTISASKVPGSKELDVQAHMLHAEVGYTFDTSWNFRMDLKLDLASGDDDPNDDAYGTYESLYGTRRGDLGNTSINGPLSRANIMVPGLRFSFKKGRWDGRSSLQNMTMYSSKDSWVVANLMDSTGASGKYIGDGFDWRVRYWVLPKQLRGEIGGSHILFGEFAKNVNGGPESDSMNYGYLMMTAYF